MNSTTEMQTETMDRGYRSPYDRGRADAYYGRKPVPHKWTGPKGAVLTPQEIGEYWTGYREGIASGDFKEW